MITTREIFYRHLGLPSSSPMGIEMERASGIFIYDTEGKQYIDLVSGVAVSNIGHLHPHVVNAIKNQLEKYMHLMVYGEYIQSPQTNLAKKLIDHLPPQLDSVYFVNSGSEAIDGALKLAKRVTGRSRIISFKNTYHGGTHGALSIMGNEQLKNAFRPLLPGISFLEFNNFENLNEITDKTACVVVESIQAEAGIILPIQGFLKALRNRCNETGTLLILDDVQMGFGRTGKLFSFEHYDFIPDILALAKGMGGGMPIGAFIASKKHMDSLTFNPELGHITTFGGHPVSCAAALASLEVIIDEKLAEQADAKGQRFEDALKNHPQIKRIRRTGLMLGLDMESDLNCEKLVTSFVKHGLITDRFLFRPNAFRIAPPLTISDSEIDESLKRIVMALDDLN